MHYKYDVNSRMSDVKINECKKQKDNDFCSCLRTVNAATGSYKEIYIYIAKKWFNCK